MNSLTDKGIFIGIGVVSLVIVLVGVFLLSNGEKPKEVSREGLVKENSQVLGSKEARVVIVEFSDFQCPACKAAEPTVKKITQEYKDKILFVYRHFPIIASHPYALKAAEAAEAAGEQGKFWQYHDILFENQENQKTEDLLKYAQDLGLDAQKFKEALDSGRFKDKVTSDMDDGENLGVSATPTFFINNQMYKGALSYDQFKEIIDKELAK